MRKGSFAYSSVLATDCARKGSACWWLSNWVLPTTRTHMCCVVASTLGRVRHAPALYYKWHAMYVGSVFTNPLTVVSRDTAIVVRRSAQPLMYPRRTHDASTTYHVVYTLSPRRIHFVSTSSHVVYTSYPLLIHIAPTTHHVAATSYTGRIHVLSTSHSSRSHAV